MKKDYTYAVARIRSRELSLLSRKDIDNLIGIGGIAQKSPFVMQMLADATGKRIDVSSCKQAAAHGSAICAAVVAGIYPTIEAAQKALCRHMVRTYAPDPKVAAHFEKRYALYKAADKFTNTLVGN